MQTCWIAESFGPDLLVLFLVHEIRQCLIANKKLNCRRWSPVVQDKKKTDHLYWQTLLQSVCKQDSVMPPVSLNPTVFVITIQKYPGVRLMRWWISTPTLYYTSQLTISHKWIYVPIFRIVFANLLPLLGRMSEESAEFFERMNAILQKQENMLRAAQAEVTSTQLPPFRLSHTWGTCTCSE